MQHIELNSDGDLLACAMRIWEAGVNAARPEVLLAEQLSVTEQTLVIASHEYDLDALSGVIVVGFGKAAAAMALQVEGLLAPLVSQGKTIRGLVNTPQDSVFSSQNPRYITVNAARPAGVNRPTQEAYEGTQRIIELVSSAQSDELILVLLSGGGSALSPAPVAGVTLEEKLQVSVFLNEVVGANIAEINCVRRQLSRIKGGGLRQAASGKAVHGLVLSDVIGDDLAVIASGPLESERDEREAALTILKKHDPQGALVPHSVYEYLSQPAPAVADECGPPVFTHVIGNNETAINAAVAMAKELGFSIQYDLSATPAASDVGTRLAEWVEKGISSGIGRQIYIGGGESSVSLPLNSGTGGRNQQLALAALVALQQAQYQQSGFCILSAGSDGEDGPTDAAGAYVTQSVLQAAAQKNLSGKEYLDRADAYHFFDQVSGLIRTGLTGTNVCDLWMVLRVVE